MVTIEKCPCGHPSCNKYGVSNGTFYQGNGWEKEDAEFVAWCFNNKEAIETLIDAGLLPEIQND